MANPGKMINVGGASVDFTISWAFVLAIGGVIIWSLLQTIQFFKDSVKDEAVATVLGFGFQFAQNFAVFMLSKTPAGKNVRIIWWLIFFVGGGLDAGTNVAQWRSENYEVARKLSIQSIIMHIVLVVIIFAEECEAYALSWAFHSTNDLIEATGHQRLPAFEYGERIANSQKAFNNPQSAAQQPQQQPQRPPQQQPQQKPKSQQQQGKGAQGPTSDQAAALLAQWQRDSHRQ